MTTNDTTPDTTTGQAPPPAANLADIHAQIESFLAAGDAPNPATLREWARCMGAMAAQQPLAWYAPTLDDVITHTEYKGRQRDDSLEGTQFTVPLGLIGVAPQPDSKPAELAARDRVDALTSALQEGRSDG